MFFSVFFRPPEIHTDIKTEPCFSGEEGDEKVEEEEASDQIIHWRSFSINKSATVVPTRKDVKEKQLYCYFGLN